jgi:hypothetical protein
MLLALLSLVRQSTNNSATALALIDTTKQGL